MTLDIWSVLFAISTNSLMGCPWRPLGILLVSFAWIVCTGRSSSTSSGSVLCAFETYSSSSFSFLERGVHLISSSTPHRTGIVGRVIDRAYLRPPHDQVTDPPITRPPHDHIPNKTNCKTNCMFSEFMKIYTTPTRPTMYTTNHTSNTRKEKVCTVEYNTT